MEAELVAIFISIVMSLYVALKNEWSDIVSYCLTQQGRCKVSGSFSLNATTSDKIIKFAPDNGFGCWLNCERGLAAVRLILLDR